MTDRELTDIQKYILELLAMVPRNAGLLNCEVEDFWIDISTTPEEVMNYIGNKAADGWGLRQVSQLPRGRDPFATQLQFFWLPPRGIRGFRRGRASWFSPPQVNRVDVTFDEPTLTPTLPSPAEVKIKEVPNKRRVHFDATIQDK
jgi:hypothetical protein